MIDQRGADMVEVKTASQMGTSGAANSPPEDSSDALRSMQPWISLYRAVTAKKPVKHMHVSVRKLLRLLTTHREYPSKEAAPLFLLARFFDVESEGRKLSGIADVHAVVGDIDHFDRMWFDRGVSKLQQGGFLGACYETYSSTPERPRWRIVVLLDEPIAPGAYL
jgi:hypothetical protein